MLKIIIGNKAYSSWSLRGWLACKQSGLPFEEIVVPLYDADWDERRKDALFTPSGGRVPILWDGDTPVWDSLAIVEYLNDKTGNMRFWPIETPARALARSMAAEMHSGFSALRDEHGMNVRRIFPARPASAAVTAELRRIMTLWAQARARFGGEGDFLFGDFGAADIMFAPVVTRLTTYSLPVPRFAQSYVEAMTAHPFLQDWIAAAQEEEWVIEKFEQA
ncbi:MAG: glutathione S-transferase family protein [Sphingomonadaceae bacterium]|nr:glutathione S-transferase family protein [Sphingomonadaceae bacterium]